jgi:hypothetical protein
MPWLCSQPQLDITRGMDDRQAESIRIWYYFVNAAGAKYGRQAAKDKT